MKYFKKRIYISKKKYKYIYFKEYKNGKKIEIDSKEYYKDKNKIIQTGGPSVKNTLRNINNTNSPLFEYKKSQSLSELKFKEMQRYRQNLERFLFPIKYKKYNPYKENICFPYSGNLDIEFNFFKKMSLILGKIKKQTKPVELFLVNKTIYNKYNSSKNLENNIIKRIKFFEELFKYEKQPLKDRGCFSFELLNLSDNIKRHSYYRDDTDFFNILKNEYNNNNLPNNRENENVPDSWENEHVGGTLNKYSFTNKNTINKILRNRKKKLYGYKVSNYYRNVPKTSSKIKNYYSNFLSTDCSKIIWGNSNKKINKLNCKNKPLLNSLLFDKDGNIVPFLSKFQRQFVFGIGEEYKKYLDCNTMFRTLLLPIDNSPEWVRWSFKLNKLFTYCATKINLLFPIRFIIPIDSGSKLGSLPYRYSFIRRNDLFSGRYEFIGIISLNVCDNLLFGKDGRKYLTLLFIDKINKWEIFVNYRLSYLDIDENRDKLNVTWYEINQLINYIGMHPYQSKLYPDILLLSYMGKDEISLIDNDNLKILLADLIPLQKGIETNKLRRGQLYLQNYKNKKTHEVFLKY